MNRLSKWLTVSLSQLALGVAGCAQFSDSMLLGARSGDVKSQMSIARLHEKQGRDGKARQIYEDVLKRDRNSGEAHQRLAVVAAKQGEYPLAEEHFQAALRLHPHDTQLLTDYGYLQFTQNKLSAAEQITRQAIANDSDNKRAKNNLALIVGRQGRYDESLALFREVVDDSKAHANVAYLYSQAGDLAHAQQHYSKSLSIDSQFKPAGQALVQLQQAEQLKAHAAIAAGVKQRSQGDQAIAKNFPAQPAPQAQAPAQQQFASAQIQPQVVEREPIPSAIPANDNELFTQPEPQVAAPQEQLSLATESNERNLPPAIPADQAKSNVRLLPAETIPTTASNDVPVLPATATAPAAVPQIAPSLSAQCPNAAGEVLNLVKLLESPEPMKRKSGVSRLGRMGKAAEAATPACIALLQDSSPVVRVHSALALWRIEKQSSRVLPTLTACLRDDDPSIRSLAAAALGEVGPSAKECLPALDLALTDEDPRIRIYVAEACCKIDREHAAALKVLTDSLADGDSVVRELGIYALGNIAPESKVVVAALGSCMTDSESRVRAAAAFALGEIGPAAAETIPALQTAQQDSHQEVRSAAQMALRRIDSKVAAAPQ